MPTHQKVLNSQWVQPLAGTLHYRMAITQKTGLEQRQALRLSQQQLRFVRLLEATAPELDEAVERELEDNPALEAGEPAADRAEVGQSGQPLPAPQMPERLLPRHPDPDSDTDWGAALPAEGESLYESLTRQLNERHLEPHVLEVARYITGSLDPNGYLRRTEAQIADDMAFGAGIETDAATVHAALEAVRSLDPPGIAAYDLQQTLALQLQRLAPSPDRDNALRVVGEQFEAFSKKHTPRVASALHLSPDEMARANDLILSLNPKPGASLAPSSDRAAAIVPDVTVDNEGGRLTITLNNRLPELRVDTTFEQAARQMAVSAAERRQGNKGNEFVTQRTNDARDFIRILRQRQQTMLEVTAALVALQRDYFLTEDVYRLRPMMIKDIAALTGHDLSVVSRATGNKWLATPWGVFPMRFFFSDTIDGDEGTDALTNRKMEAEIEAIVGAEDKAHPLSDEKIRLEMMKKGYDVSRRTIAKYRDRVGIPVARLRRNI